MMPACASAHGRSVSYSTWKLDGGHVQVSVRVADLDLSAVELALDPPPAEPAASATAEDDAVAAYLSRTVTASADAGACSITGGARSTAATDGWRTVTWSLQCPNASAYTLRIDLLFDALPGHLHFARIDAAGRASVERLVTGEQRTWTISAASGDARVETHGSSFREYVMLGIRHILSGYDHVAFLVALLLLAGTLREVAWVVSSFTAAHSITLALAALGLAHPNPGGIEALIGFSIALVAIENAWLLAGRPRFVPIVLTVVLLVLASVAEAGIGLLRPIVFLGLALFCASHFSLMARVRDATRLRVVVAFCFGLAHGFGFAGVLAEIATDSGRLVRGLLGFNAGVELGQLAIVAAVWPLLLLAQRVRAGAPRVFIAEVGSALVCGLGTFWFLVRVLA